MTPAQHPSVRPVCVAGCYRRGDAGTAPICAEGAVALGGVPNVSDYERLLDAIGESEA